MSRECGLNAPQWSQVAREVRNPLVGIVIGFLCLLEPHRYERARYMRCEQLHGAHQLWLARILQAGFVAPHARTAPAREDQAVQRCAAHALTPPRLDSRRTRSIRMSCESALHIS